MELSQRQRRAVERSGQDACIVAGPGSGKTRTLVERFAWLVERGSAPGSILAITFTEKAAREIKSRLVERFSAREDLRAEIEHAPVATMHGLCQRLLRENAIEAGLDPEFEILDELRAWTEQHRAAEEALDRAAAERREEFRLLADSWAAPDMAATLLRLYEEIRAGDWGGKLELTPVPDPAARLDEIETEAWQGAEAATSGSEAVRERGAKLRAFAAARSGQDPLAWLASFDLDKRAKNAALNASIEAIRIRQQTARQAVLAARHAARREMARDLLFEFHALYAARKRSLAVLDFHDLEEFTIALLQGNPALRADLAERYEAILMDELQDTNPVQWRLVNLLRRPGRFFAVGDLNQSIYGFRHADPELFRAYRTTIEGCGGEIDVLAENYRSRPGILEALELLSAQLPGIEAQRLESRGEFAPKAGPGVELLRVEGEAEEAEWIARRILELRAEYGYGWGDFAVLTRKKSTLAEVEGALVRRGIPSAAQRGEPFFDRPEIVDLVNWLRVLEEPADEIATVALLRSPLYGVADEEIYRLRGEGGLAPAEVAERWGRLREARSEAPVSLLLARHLDECGYLATLDARGRANVDKFLRLLRDWERTAPAAPSGWLAEIDLLREAGEETSAAVAGVENAVTLSSMHGAKGLEFPVVFVSFLQQGTRHASEAVAWTKEDGLGFAWRDPRSDEAVADFALERIRQRRAGRETGEAGRLLYVATTRAEDHLALTWTVVRRSAPWPEAVEAAFLFHPQLPLDEPVEREGVRYLRVSQPAGEAEQAGGWAREESPEILVAPVEVWPARGSGYRVTDVGRYLRCPRQWLLDQVANPEPEEEQPGSAFGTIVHRLLAGEEVPEADAETRAYAERFASTPLGRRVAAARRVEREYDFLFAVEDSVFRGRVDLWFEENDGRRVVVDYKTGKRPDPETMEAYRVQLRLYRRAAPGGAAELWLAFIGDRTEEQVEGDGEDDLLGDFLDGVAQHRFPLRPGPECEHCPHYGGACPQPPVQAAAGCGCEE